MYINYKMRIEKDFSKLIVGRGYGTNSRAIYKKFCETLNWDDKQIFQFGQQGRPLFAYRANSDKTCAVWFISHSNYTNTKADSGVHDNKIFDDRIEEYYAAFASDPCVPLIDRITFAKNKYGQYVFIGVYRARDPQNKSALRIFDKLPIDCWTR